MARIRTIKPEFPQSESMGRVSRDARLAFVMLWTISDDEGRLRGNSRMLASLLFPYDDDARDKIDLWLSELEAEGCIERYVVHGDSYVQICNWLDHQKIDKPSRSKMPSPLESSRILSNHLESSALDQGRDQGRGGEVDQGSKDLLPPTPASGEKPKKARRNRDDVLADLESVGIPAEVIAAGIEILGFWPKKDPDGREIRAEADLLIPRLDDISKRQPLFAVDVLVEAGKTYCAANLKRYKAPQYFFSLKPEEHSQKPPFYEWAKAVLAKRGIVAQKSTQPEPTPAEA